MVTEERLNRWAASGLVAALLGMASPAMVVWSSAADGASADGLAASPERDWPQWRGARRDGVTIEKGLLAIWPEGGPKLLWKVGNLGRGWSSPIIVNGTLWITGDVGDELVIYAFDLNGKLKWQTKNGAAWKGSYPGARTCCAFSEGRLHHMNAHGRVVCLDAATGKEVWAVDIIQRFESRVPTWAMSECLLVDGPRVIVTPGGAKAMMAALDKTNGQTVWASEPIAGDQPAYASPILFRWGGRHLLASCSGSHGFGVDADTGRLLWRVPCETPYKATVATPVYAGGCVFYVCPGSNGALYRLKASADGVNAEEVWRTDLDSLTGSCVLVDGTLYGGGYRSFKHWVALDWATGRTKSEYRDLTTGAAIHAEGRLYALGQDGRVVLLKLTPSGFELAGQFQLDAQPRRDAWAHPVLLDGRLYLRYHDTLWCYDVRAK